MKQVGELKITQVPAAGTPVTCAAPVISDLTFTVPTSDAAAFTGWSGPKNGALEYLAADGSMLLKIKFAGLKKKSQAAEGALTRITASVESVTLAKR